MSLLVEPIFLLSVATVCYFTHTLWIPIFWLVCGATSQWAFFRLRTLTEHGGVDITPRVETNLLFRAIMFPHNTHMHYEHHAYPTVPLWNLPELRKHLQSTEPLMNSREVLQSLAQVPAFPWEMTSPAPENALS